MKFGNVIEKQNNTQVSLKSIAQDLFSFALSKCENNSKYKFSINDALEFEGIKAQIEQILINKDSLFESIRIINSDMDTINGIDVFIIIDGDYYHNYKGKECVMFGDGHYNIRTKGN